MPRLRVTLNIHFEYDTPAAQANVRSTLWKANSLRTDFFSALSLTLRESISTLLDGTHDYSLLRVASRPQRTDTRNTEFSLSLLIVMEGRAAYERAMYELTGPAAEQLPAELGNTVVKYLAERGMADGVEIQTHIARVATGTGRSILDRSEASSRLFPHRPVR